VRQVFIYFDSVMVVFFFFFQAEDGIRDGHVTGVQTCALPISKEHRQASSVFPPITLRQPRAFDFILVTRGTAVGAAAPDEEELQPDPGDETAHVRPPGYASHIARSCQRQSATEHLAQRPESEIGYRWQLE